MLESGPISFLFALRPGAGVDDVKVDDVEDTR